jgi:hypothetical protein
MSEENWPRGSEKAPRGRYTNYIHYELIRALIMRSQPKESGD